MALAGCGGPILDAEDIAYTREVLIPYLDAEDMRTCIECLFGDAAARTLGFTPRGLSAWAGMALALHDARAVAASFAFDLRSQDQDHGKGTTDRRSRSRNDLSLTG